MYDDDNEQLLLNISTTNSKIPKAKIDFEFRVQIA